MKIITNLVTLGMLCVLFMYTLSEWAQAEEQEFFEAEMLCEQQENQE